MKKYITIAALLAAGSACANAETLAEINTTDESLVAYWNFDENSNPTKGSGWASLPVWNKDGYGVLDSSTNHPSSTDAKIAISAGFTVSFDISGITKSGTALTMLTQNKDWRILYLDVTDEGDLSAYIKAKPEAKVTGKVSTDGWSTVTLVGEKLENNHLSLVLYVDGSQSTSVTVGATNFSTETANNILFGCYGDANSSANMSLDNILIYNRALTAGEVKALTVAVPEPSAFGLLAGLGALALVASRRRRK